MSNASHPLNVYARARNNQPPIDDEDPNMILLRSENTDKNYSRASQVYDEFARKTGFPLMAHLSPADLTGERGNTVGLSYAAFLLDYRHGNLYYAVNTILEYYKGWLNKLSKKRGSWKRVIENAKNDWSNEIFTKLQMRASVAAIKRGESINKKTRAIRRKMMKGIILHVLKKNNTADAYEDRLVLAMLRSAVGRSGEVSTANWKFAHWCDEAQMLITEWPEVKTGHSSVLSFGPDADTWELDVIHSLAAYLITSEGFAGPDNGDTSWVLPRYAKFSDGGANKRANRIIKNCVGTVSTSMHFLQNIVTHTLCTFYTFYTFYTFGTLCTFYTIRTFYTLCTIHTLCTFCTSCTLC